MPSAGKRDTHRVKNRTFDEAFGGGFIAARRLTTDDAAKRFRPGLIGDDAIFRGQFISLAIQRQQAFAFMRHAHGQRFALHLCGVENVQGAAQAIGEKIGHIHQRIDWALANRHQPILQPFRRRSILHTTNGAAQHIVTSARISDCPNQRRRIGGLDRGFRQRLQAPKPGCGQIPRHAVDGKRIAAIGRHADFNNRVIQPGPAHIGLTQGSLRGQINNTGMIIAQAHFAGRQHHGFRFHAANFASLQCNAGAGNKGAGQSRHTLHARARIRRAADHGQQLAIARINLQRAQPICIGVLFGFNHMGNAEIRERSGAIFHTFNLKPDGVQRGENLIKCGLRIKMRLQPGKGEFHRLTLLPPKKVGKADRRRNALTSGYRPHRRGADRECRVSAW